MSANGIRAFDSTMQLSMEWIRDLKQELHTEDDHRAYVALRSTLFALRDRLTVEEAADLAAQLPMLLRGLFYDGWRPSQVPVKMHHEEFLDAVRKNIGQGTSLSELHRDPERAVRAVFQVLQRRISAGEIADIVRILPMDLRAFWLPEQRRAA